MKKWGRGRGKKDNKLNTHGIRVGKMEKLMKGCGWAGRGKKETVGKTHNIYDR